MVPQPMAYDQASTVRVAGDLLSTTADVVLKAARDVLADPSALNQAGRVLKLDLTATKMVDSVGLNAIVTMLKEARKGGGSMQIAYRDANVHRTLLFTRLNEQITLIKE